MVMRYPKLVILFCMFNPLNSYKLFHNRNMQDCVSYNTDLDCERNLTVDVDCSLEQNIEDPNCSSEDS